MDVGFLMACIIIIGSVGVLYVHTVSPLKFPVGHI